MVAEPTLATAKTIGIQLQSDRSRANRRLSEIAKYLVIPKDIVGSYWPTLRPTCSEKLGIEFDRWQDDAAGLILAKRSDGSLAHTVDGVGMSICRQTGKCLDIETPLLTVGGWTTLANIKVGDQVFHPSGHPTLVTQVHPILYDHDCYEVTTTDGRMIVVDAEHLWAVRDKKRRCDRTLTTAEMLDEGLDRYGSTRLVATDGVLYQTKEYRFALPRQEALKDISEQELQVDPYLLGAWLGNGTTGGAQATFGDQDINHWLAEIKKVGFAPSSRLDNHDGNSRWSVGIPGGFRRQLRELGVLNDKHIPEQYLIGSTRQRLALLQGLLDTDGYIDPRHGTVEFCSMTRNLADGVLFLARSLGWRATLNEGKAKLDGRDYGIKYRVCFTPKLVDGMNPFRLERKASLVQASDRGKGRFTVSIKSIEPVASRPVRCIKVDYPDGLFLAGRDLVVTHNTFTIAGLVFSLCVEYPGMLAIWSAHHAKTHMETFMALQGFTKRTKVAPFVSKVYTGSGDEEVRFVNGSRILFGARERGFGRGIPGVDVLIMDEGQIMSERAMQNMLATMNTSRLGLHIYAGTPPKPEDNSENWLRMRDEALSGESTDLAWIEMGADDDASLDDVEQWKKANCSVPHRTPLVSVQRLRKKLGDDGFRREGLGIYDKDDGSVFDINRWLNLGDEELAKEIPERVTLTVDVSPDRKWSCIGVAGELEDGRLLVMCHSLRGTSSVVPKLLDLKEKREIIEISIFAGGQARALEPDLVQANVDYERLSATEMGAAQAALQEFVKAGTVVHCDQPELNMAIANARTRFLMSGESEQIDRRESTVDLSPVMAVAGAAYRFGMVESPMPFIC